MNIIKSNFKPFYVWPGGAFRLPFRIYYEGPKCRIFIIENIQHNWNWITECHGRFRKTDFFFVLIGCYYDISAVKQASQMFNILNLDRSQFFVLFNCNQDKYNFESEGFHGEIINQNAWLDENHVMKSMNLQKIYNAIYVGRRSAVKRHYLAGKVKHLALVSGNNHGNPVSEIPPHDYLNEKPLSPQQVCEKINQSYCGLILSQKEGANFSSSEYLLCGVPVVSTPSQGGRHVWYNDYNSIICDSTEDAVAEAVEELVRHPRDSQCIRQMHIEQAEEYRRKFIDVLAEVFNRFGVTDVEPDVYFRENFFHKLRKSYKPDFQAIFPSENQRVFAPAMYSVNPNVLSKYKDQYRGGMSEWRLLTGKSKANHILSLCSANKIAPSSLIEVGCGEGAILENLNDQNFCENMYAIDISESGIRVILSRELKNLKEAKVFDGYHIPYPDQSFDLAICSHVLEHVEYERILLREIARVSKRFIIEVPIDYRPGADAIANHFFAYGHINMYTPTTLRFLLKSEGFSIIDDIVDITDPEASCYNYFFNQRKEEPTQDNIKAQLDRLAAEVEKFKKKTRMQQEESASDYTVLVDSMTKGIKIF